MNEGLFPQQYGAPMRPYRTRYSYGQGTSRVDGEALVFGITDTTTSTFSARGYSGAMAYNVCDLVIQVPLSVTHKYDQLSAVAFGAIITTIPDGTSKGGNARGICAVDFQSYRQFAPQVASGAFSVIAGGAWNTASGPYTFVAGGGSSATNTGSIAIGWGCTSSGIWGVAIGIGATATQYGSVALGAFPNDNGVQRTMTFAGSLRAASGDRNIRQAIPQSAVTTNDTATVLTTDAGAAGAVDATNTWALPNNRAAVFTGYVIARNTTSSEVAAWKLEGVMRRAASAATTAFVGTPTITQISADAAMAACTLTAAVNTTDGALRLTATGLAATTIAWNGTLYGPEVG